MRSFRIPVPGEARATAEFGRAVNYQASILNPRRGRDAIILNGQKITHPDQLDAFFRGGSFHYQFAGIPNKMARCDSAKELQAIKDRMTERKLAVIVRHV